MKKVIRKMIAISLSFALLISSASAVSAYNEEYLNSYQSEVTVEELIESGYTPEHARRLLEFDRIIKKMEVYGQSVDIDENGEVFFSTADNNINYLTDAEMNLAEEMIRFQIEEQNTAICTRAQAYEALFETINEDPGQSSYSIQISPNTELTATTIIRENASDRNVVMYGSSGPLIQGQYQFFDYGYKDIEYELVEKSGAYYAKCQVEARATSSQTSMKLTKMDSAQASVGIISIQNASLQIMQDEATETGDYCQVSNNVVFAITGSVGATLKGVVSLSLNAGANWTQKAIIRAHKTSGYGIVWTLADVYKI